MDAIKIKRISGRNPCMFPSVAEEAICILILNLDLSSLNNDQVSTSTIKTHNPARENRTTFLWNTRNGNDIWYHLDSASAAVMSAGMKARDHTTLPIAFSVTVAALLYL